MRPMADVAAMAAWIWVLKDWITGGLLVRERVDGFRVQPVLIA